MNNIDFKIEKDIASGNVQFFTQIFIDGKNLIEMLKDYELPFAKKEGCENIAGAYAGIPPKKLYTNLTDCKKSGILECECGLEGCWTFRVKIIEKEDCIIWTDFEQIHRSKNSDNYWDYSNFNNLRFEKNEYFNKLKVLNI